MMFRYNRWIHLMVALCFLLVFMMTAALAGQSMRERLRKRIHQNKESRSHQSSVKGTTLETINLNGTLRTYQLHVPAKLNQHQRYPLVLSFHGFNSSAAGQESLSGFSALADKEGFIVVYPEGVDAKWRFLDRNGVDVHFIDELLADVKRRVSVDERRIYANGISNGAQMVWRLACDRPNLFAAVGFVSGSYPGLCPEPRPPAIIFHGTKDRLLPYNGRGRQMPVRDFARGWVGNEDHLPSAQGEVVFRKGDATGEKWVLGRQSVVLYTLTGKGHSWPGSSMPAGITSKDIDATNVMWAFFKERSLSNLQPDAAAPGK